MHIVSVFHLFCILCLLGIISGVLVGDGTFINFRGLELQRAIELLDQKKTN